MKVLVVEDDPLSMELAFEILNKHGFRVEGAEDGAEAVKKAEKEVYELILMNIGLRRDCVEAVKIIKSKPQYQNVPVIALTAHAMNGDKERLLANGFDDYISKPIDVPQFIKRMKKYMM